jgi:hypothetical protein
MNRLRLVFLSFLTAFALLGCAGTMEPIAVPEHLSEVGKEAQKLINEANVALIAAYDVVREKRRDRLISKLEALGHLDRLDKYSEDVDDTQEALDRGNDIAARGKAELTKALITALHKEVAARARQP